MLIGQILFQRRFGVRTETTTAVWALRLLNHRRCVKAVLRVWTALKCTAVLQSISACATSSVHPWGFLLDYRRCHIAEISLVTQRRIILTDLLLYCCCNSLFPCALVSLLLSGTNYKDARNLTGRVYTHHWGLTVGLAAQRVPPGIVQFITSYQLLVRFPL